MRPYNLQPFNANAAVLTATYASLSDRDYIADCAGKMNASRDWLCGELAKDGRKFIPSQANFVMIGVGTEVQPVVDQFRARNILVGRRFPTMNNWLRVSIGKQAEMESFLAAFREIVPAPASKAA